MLEKKRKDRLHGMGDERWKTKDKLVQYRGLIKFFAREQKQQLYDNANLRRKQQQIIRELRKDIVFFRKLLNDTSFGDKQGLRNALQQNRELQLAFQELLPPKVVDHIKQVNNTKRKELDRLKFSKQQKMEMLMNLQLQKADLEDWNDIMNSKKPRYAEQVVINLIQKARLRYSAAMNINKTYKNIVDILKQDSIYFETVSEALHSDSVAQSLCIIQATRMGQEATEHLANIQEEYGGVEKQVKENMKQRDMAVRALRKNVHNLYRECLGLIRVESDTDILKSLSPKLSETDLYDELAALEVILTDVQATTHVSTYDDIFPRIKDQLYQKNRLKRQLEQNAAVRDSFLNKKNHAELMIQSLESHMADSTFYYKEEKARLLREIAYEENRMEKAKVFVEEEGDLLVVLRCSLQTLLEMVARVSAQQVQEEEEEEYDAESRTMLIETPMLEDAQEIIKMVVSKMELLMTLIPEEPADTLVQRAKASYQKKKADIISIAEFPDVPEYEVQLVDLDDLEDASVPTRLEIKQRSKDIVNMFERPEEMEIGSIPQESTKQKRPGKR